MTVAEFIKELQKHDSDAVVLTKSFVPIREPAALHKEGIRLIPNLYKEGKDDRPDNYLILTTG